MHFRTAQHKFYELCQLLLSNRADRVFHLAGINRSYLGVNIEYLSQEAAQCLVAAEHILGYPFTIRGKLYTPIPFMFYQPLLGKLPQGRGDTGHLNPQSLTHLAYPDRLIPFTEHNY